MTGVVWVRMVLASGLIGAGVVSAAPDEDASLPQVDDYGMPLVAYVTVERTDGTYRRMLTQPQTLAAVGDGAPVPDGARIFMETYYSPGSVSTVFHKHKIDGQWHYGSFSASRPDLDVRPQASCLSCHADAAETDFVFTLPSLSAAAQCAGPGRFTCDRGGRRPCAPAVYRDGAAE